MNIINLQDYLWQWIKLHRQQITTKTPHCHHINQHIATTSTSTFPPHQPAHCCHINQHIATTSTSTLPPHQPAHCCHINQHIAATSTSTYINQHIHQPSHFRHISSTFPPHLQHNRHVSTTSPDARLLLSMGDSSIFGGLVEIWLM